MSACISALLAYFQVHAYSYLMLTRFFGDWLILAELAARFRQSPHDRRSLCATVLPFVCSAGCVPKSLLEEVTQVWFVS